MIQFRQGSVRRSSAGSGYSLLWSCSGKVCGRRIDGRGGEARRSRTGYSVSVFSTKVELVIETAELYWERVARKYLQELEEANTGYAQIEKTLDIFYKIFQNEKPFLKFLQEFDVFVKKYQISEKRLTDYESGILKLKPYVTDSLEKRFSRQ